MKAEDWSGFWRSRAFRLSFSVLALTLSVMFTADLLGLRGDSEKVVREARKTIAEALAVQLSTLASSQDVPGIRYSVASFVNRNRDVAAAALVEHDGAVLASFGETSELPEPGQASTLRHMIVPILNRSEPWGEVRVTFRDGAGLGSQLRYFLFVLAGCLLLYLLFLRKALDQLDPSRVVPTRVSSAFEMLSDGVVILDGEMKILLANQALADSVGRKPETLVGQNLSQWAWEQSGEWQAPWETALATGLNVVNESLRLRMDDGDTRTFMISATPVGNQDDGLRGVLVTLDDMTVIERKNRELSTTLRQLRKSQDAISRKNRELEALATQDPLTGLANRRALLQNFERQFAKARREAKELSCVMVDIDHFKRINDTLGHAAGDEVICAVANKLVEVCREYDFVGRFGGEEFVVVLPDIGGTDTLSIAERLRAAVEAMGQDPLLPVNQISASFGTATLSPDVENPMALLERADQALYVAKQRGRNRVEAYDPRIVKLKPVADERPAASADAGAARERLAELESMVDERTRDLEQLRNFDTLTGIPRRELFLQRIEAEIHRANRFGTRLAVLSLEVKDLDRIATSLGYGSSESLLVSVVARLQESLRQTDMVSEVTREHSLSRVESNEFGVLLTDLGDVADVMPVLGRLRRELTRPFLSGEQKVYVGANIGVAMYPESGAQSDELLKNAGVARIKASGQPEKVSHRFASASLDDASREYVQLEADLYEAVEQGAFEVHYQPIYDVERRCVSALEALLRWPHPERGYVPPDVFIGIAEDNGLINRISDFVLETAVSQLARWHELGWTHLRMTVNVSPVQLRDPALAGRVVGVIERTSLRPECLEVELTETSVMDSPQRARVVLSQLREAGISVAMDDFGTGYSSLALLADLPLDSVKIDRSFVGAMEHSQRSRSIVESVINMAHALGLKVIGEGIETNAQFDALAALGCQELQGYLLSKPMCAEDAEAFLRTQSGQPRQAL